MAEMPNIIYEPVKLKIGRLKLKPGQLLVLKFPKGKDIVDLQRLVEIIESVIPNGAGAIILKGDVEVSVVEKNV